MANTKRPSDAPYQVLARRFRPTKFDDLVGQESLVTTLRSAIGSGRVPHAFLFTGSRGVGKTTSARILARCLNCVDGPTADPCGKCSPCTTILAGSNTDVVEIDAASNNGVDDIRELRERAAVVSMGARYKVYILDEVHMLSRSAFNAFLKVLEEPPRDVVFVLATTELHKVPETIRSRCQVQHLRRLQVSDMVERLRAICAAEGVSVADEILVELAAGSRGGMRDAETALEKVLPLAAERGSAFDLAAFRSLQHRVGADVVVDVVQQLLAGEAAAALRFAAEVVDGGADERDALGDVLETLRAVLLLQVDGDDSLLVQAAGPMRARMAEMARGVDRMRVEAMVQAGLIGRDRIRRLEDRRLVLELTLLRMAEAGALPQLADLVAAARSGIAPAAAAGSAPQPSRPAQPATPQPQGRAQGRPRAAGKPAAGKPAAGKPAAGKPIAGKPAAGKPAAGGDLRTRLLAQLKQDNPLLARTVEQCTVHGPDDRNKVWLELRSEQKLHQDRLASAGVQEQIRMALRTVVGADVALALGRPSGAPAERRAAGPAVHRAMESFDGQIVDDDDLDQP